MSSHCSSMCLVCVSYPWKILFLAYCMASPWMACLLLIVSFVSFSATKMETNVLRREYTTRNVFVKPFLCPWLVSLSGRDYKRLIVSRYFMHVIYVRRVLHKYLFTLFTSATTKMCNARIAAWLSLFYPVSWHSASANKNVITSNFAT